MIKKANKKVAILNFVVLFILILVGLFVLSVPQFDLSSLSVASFYLYFPSVALLLVYCILYLSFALRFLYKGIIIKHNKTEPTYTKTSLFLCEKRRFFMARTEKGVVATI